MASARQVAPEFPRTAEVICQPCLLDGLTGRMERRGETLHAERSFFCLADRPFGENLIADRMPPDITYGTGQLGVIAAVAAYRDGGPWLDDVIGILDGNRALLAELLAERNDDGACTLTSAPFSLVKKI